MAFNRIHHPLIQRQYRNGFARRGVTIVLVVMLLVLLQVAVLGTLASAARQVDLMAVTSQAMQARYSAEGLLQRAARELTKNLDEDGNGTIGTIGPAGGNFAVAVTTVGSDRIITSTVTNAEVTRSLRSRWTITFRPAGTSLLNFRAATATATFVSWSDLTTPN